MHNQLTALPAGLAAAALLVTAALPITTAATSPTTPSQSSLRSPAFLSSDAPKVVTVDRTGKILSVRLGTTAGTSTPSPATWY